MHAAPLGAHGDGPRGDVFPDPRERGARQHAVLPFEADLDAAPCPQAAHATPLAPRRR